VISYVNISQTQVSDSGLYRCSADNGLAQVSHQAQISVLGPIQVKPMANLTVLASTSMRVRCPVAGHPVAEIQWHHNGRRLPANHRQRVHENGTLEVEHMERSQGDEGEYVCVALGPAQSQQQQQQQPTAASAGQLLPSAQAYGSLHVSIKVRPTIEPFAISRSLREGQRASIMCTISSGDLPISISWFRNERQLVFGPDGQQQAAFGGQLLAGAGSPQVAPSDEQRGQQQQQQASWWAASGEPAQVAAAAGGQREQAAANESALLGVRMSRVSDYSSSLLFESLLAQHSANYTCLARNEAGWASHQAPMVVQGEYSAGAAARASLRVAGRPAACRLARAAINDRHRVAPVAT